MVNRQRTRQHKMLDKRKKNSIIPPPPDLISNYEGVLATRNTHLLIHHLQFKRINFPLHIHFTGEVQ